MKKLILLTFALALVSGASAQTVLDNFTSITSVNNPPAGVGVAGTWYDSTNAAYSTIVLDAGAAKATDGGFTNGYYAEMTQTIPADGWYTISLNVIEVFDDPANLDGIRGIEVGVIINGTHRPENPGNINTTNPTLTAVGSSNLTFDVTNNSVVGAPIADVIVTPLFEANAGDSIFIILACDAADVSAAGGWGTSFYKVDDLILSVPASVPVELDYFAVD
jgi:hypothetical protein